MSSERRQRSEETGDTGSVWATTLPDDERFISGTESPPTEVDVAIVGAGFTGLWTAWYLHRTDPSLRIAVVERHTVGSGASGRNGGWCSALLPMSHSTLTAGHGVAATIRFQRAMHDNIAEIGALVDELHDHPSAIFRQAGTIDLARNLAQQRRLRAHLDELHGLGFGDADYRWLDAAEARSLCAATKVTGAVWTPHCATVHPLRLVHLLARNLSGRGVTIAEHTEVGQIAPGRIETSAGPIRAEIVIRATEAYSTQFRGHARDLLPIYSMMIATEPLDAATWESIGLDQRPTFADARHLVIYGQRTADDRLAFGGRGAPYHFGSRIRPEFDTDESARGALTNELRDLFPILREAQVTHHWGGVLGAARDWTCSVRFDRRTGLGFAGGYVGDGVATAHLAGRTLSSLVTGNDSDLIRLPWVGHRSPKWEPEPLRWLGVSLAQTAAERADRGERRGDHGGKLWARMLSRLTS